ncbi:RNA polymerase factor sigma-54 [Myxococcota bacterium]|nr:RNA polymerase factor sigma-54 [Myxococcota bacterium]MBU1431655.1 RNA polymerase factor sigma-54 [Myxococcota bacterium]MBU1900016.1 RNA polymerase factor sigma-54 [Myxococcota bacterium]
MPLELKLELKMTQQLRMTPLLQQAIRLLQLSRADLVDAVREELLSNPMLEEQSEMAATEAAHTEGVAEVAKREEKEKAADVEGDSKDMDQAHEQIDWEAYFENYSSPTPGTGTQRLRDDDLPGVEATLSRSTTLFDHLIWQLQVSEFNDQEERVAVEIIGNINDDGYFQGVTLEQIATSLDQDLEYVEEILEMIQEFDPIGVGARDLCECLLIQAEFNELGAIVYDIIRDHLSNLEKKNYSAIARQMEIELDEVIEAAKLISQLEPRPGRPFVGEEPRYITPDIYIRKRDDGQYQAILNDDGMPRLKISNFYRNALRNQSSAEAKDYVTEKLNSAKWLIRSIQQRQRTIVKVTESIIKFQIEFLELGVTHLKPLILRDVADDIGMHESTVSRVTTNKYVHTPQGIYELKYFFNSSIQGDAGDHHASKAVKSLIRTLVANENPKKPYSDQKLADMLKQQHGIRIARRTVAKYREAMRILPSSKRKSFF